MKKILSIVSIITALYGMDDRRPQLRSCYLLPVLTDTLRHYPIATLTNRHAYDVRSADANERILESLCITCTQLESIMASSDSDDIQKILDEGIHKQHLLRCFIWIQRQAELASRPPEQSLPPAREKLYCWRKIPTRRFVRQKWR